MKKRAIRIYTCKAHPDWSLETSAPVMAGGLKQICPLCRQDFLERQIGLADCRTEYREIPDTDLPDTDRSLL